jgi:uncharacterized membrane protein
MNETILSITILLAALGSGLIAGLLFTFSNFVMKALGKTQPTQGISAMQSINITILNPLFLLIFMGTAVTSIFLPVSLLWRGEQPNSIFLIIGSLSYIVGVMGVTIVFNVPMNNRLEAVEAESNEAHTLWQQYLTDWTRWNHVRTVASVLAMLFFILALV